MPRSNRIELHAATRRIRLRLHQGNGIFERQHVFEFTGEKQAACGSHHQQTMPVFVQHRRKLESEGLLRAESVFDAAGCLALLDPNLGRVHGTYPFLWTNVERSAANFQLEMQPQTLREIRLGRDPGYFKRKTVRLLFLYYQEVSKETNEVKRKMPITQTVS